MKKDQLFNIINDIDEKIIEEAEMEAYIPDKKGMKFIKILTPVAICLAIIFIVLPNYMDRQMDLVGPVVDSNLPRLSMGEFKSDGSGFEGWMAYDIDQIKNRNPWNQAREISTLPVFKNKLNYTERGVITNIDIDTMRERLQETIDLLKINRNDLEIIDNYPSRQEMEEMVGKIEATGQEFPVDFLIYKELSAQSKKYQIRIRPDLSISIAFKKGELLPKKYRDVYNLSYEDSNRLGNYLKKKHKGLLGMKKPIVNIYDGSYTYDGDQRFGISFFDGKGSLEQQIINYNFNDAEFGFDDKGRIDSLYIYKPDLSHLIGQYPIISTKEAENLLIDNKYISNVPEAFPGKEYIKKVELVYEGKHEENFMPYYRFFVELQGWEQENGLKTYGVYYVPAVKEKYIDDFSIMDKKFN